MSAITTPPYLSRLLQVQTPFVSMTGLQSLELNSTDLELPKEPAHLPNAPGPVAGRARTPTAGRCCAQLCLSLFWVVVLAGAWTAGMLEGQALRCVDSPSPHTTASNAHSAPTTHLALHLACLKALKSLCLGGPDYLDGAWPTGTNAYDVLLELPVLRQLDLKACLPACHTLPCSTPSQLTPATDHQPGATARWLKPFRQPCSP